MLNDWFSIGPLTVHGYGVMIAVGILAAVGMAEKLAKEYDLDYKNIDAFALFVVVLGYVGAKALYVLTNLDAFMISPASVLGSGGWVVYGGIIGGLLAALVWCKWKKWDFRKYFVFYGRMLCRNEDGCMVWCILSIGFPVLDNGSCDSNTADFSSR